VSGVPELNSKLDNEARRFVSLVDEFYDRRVNLVLSAQVGILELYRGKRLTFEFERTASRLQEMQSHEYFQSPHLS
jgi:cell division protein ZapE